MTWIERRMGERVEELKELYNPKTSFGDVRVIKLIRAIEEDKEYLETRVKCPDCEGEGVVDHECDCLLCNVQEEDCGECDGEGYKPASEL